jgi:SAM-dependent methyltransferase
MRHQAEQEVVKRRVENGRLVYYKQAADAVYWNEHWKNLISSEYYTGAIGGQLGRYEEVFTKYLPSNERILEAGCGLATIVLALQKRGYQIEGVDWAEETVARVKSLFPDLPIKKGDVCSLPVKDEYYGGYISLGVIEHRRQGPEPFLTEAIRVLKPGGVAIFSVPFFNPLRRIKGFLNYFFKKNIRHLEFYQYAYGLKEMKGFLEVAGFNIIDGESCNLQMGFEDEIPFLYSLYRLGFFGRILKRFIRGRKFFLTFFGHSRIYVCRKP